VQRARAWIDLNRDPREIDPAMIEGPLPRDMIATVRTRSGLGLIPRRIGNGPQLVRRRLAASEVEERIRLVHTPYHAAIAEALTGTRARFGTALLLDCHSMPPVAGPNPRERPDVVIGDRYGRSAATALGDRLESAIRAQGLKTARNTPYAGGYTLDRHGRPDEGIHALQIEFDRSLYLDAKLDQPGSGIDRVRRIFNMLFDILAEECDPGSNRIAAE
jgi:N-formylglutamate amidohydrolase